MKKKVALAVFVSLLFVYNAYAQTTPVQDSAEIKKQETQNVSQTTNKKIKWNAGLGFVTNWRNSANLFQATNLCIAIEPNYIVSEKLSLGLKAEYSFSNKYYSGPNDSKVTASPIPSLSFIAQYGFINSKLKPTIGLGLGLFGLGSSTYVLNNIEQSITNGTCFGLTPRISLPLKKITLVGELNIINEKNKVYYHNRDYASLKAYYRF